MNSREQVYHAIDGERAYQKVRWNDDEVYKSVGDFMIFMRHHLTKAEASLSSSEEITGALHELRKVAALAVACMEYHGAPERL